MDKKAFTAAVKYALQTEGDKCKLNPDITYSRYAKLTREEQIKYAEAYLKFRINEKNLKGKISGGQINTLIHRPADINNPNSLDIHQKQVDRVKKIPLKYKQ